MKKRKGRIAQLLVMSVISLAMALSIYRNPEYESLVVLLLLWCYFGWNLWTTQQLAKSRSKAVVELERSTVLIRCVTELSSHEDMDRAINNLLKIVTEYFEGDRSYIVKVDYENQLVHNTYEHAAPGITKEIDNLQQVPLQVVQSWLDKFQKHGMFYISDLDREKEAKTYDILKAQNINSLIAVPFKKDGTVIGFFGVDNPRKYYRDFQLLSSIQFFLMNRLEMKDRQEQLQYLSYRDLLTNLYNRNYYIRLLEKSRGRCFKNLGVVYIDLNGLKQINDEQGHEAGDSFIRRAAQQIVAVFPERTYRIGGDEFVVIYPDILQQQFEFLINQLRLNARQHHVSISCGSVWRTECMALDEMLKEADEKMYEDKKKFYEKENMTGDVISEDASIWKEPVIRTTGRNNCGGRCVICVHMKDGKIDHLSTEHPCDAPEEEIPLTACVRGLNYHKTFLGEDRLRYPMKRVGKRGEGKFTRISWEEAVDTIASEWIRIRDTYGVGSRYVNYATGISALNRGNNMAKRLLNLDGGFLDYYNSYSTACIRQATDIMYGTNQTGHDPEDWLNSNLIILWGHNPEETKFDSVTMNVLLRAKKKGISIIVIDPRRNDTAVRLDAEWIPVRPATDSALMDAMAWVIVEEGLQDQDFLDRCCIGFDKAHMPEGVDPSECYLSYLYGEKDGVSKTPEWAEGITGVPADTIRSLARRYAKAKPAALIQGYGPQRNANGEQSTRGGILLACMTGNVGISGGWASGVADWKNHKLPSWPKLVNHYNRQIPVYLWTDAVLHGRTMNQLDGVQWIDGSEEPVTLESDIKMILNLAGNCLINQHGDINRTAEILRDESKCEFIVVSDLFMTASAKFADILLPGISMFECENITMPWLYTDFLGFNNKVMEPLYEGRFEYDWLSEVADRLGLKEQFTCGRTASEWLEYLYEELRKTETELPDYEIFKKQALFRYQKQPIRPAFKEKCSNPETHPFPTKSGKIEIFSEKVYRTEFKEFMPAIPRYVPPVEGPQDPLAEKYPLQLTGWHTKRRCHSIHDNNQAMHKIDPQMLWMNPVDAAARNLQDGDMAEVFNDRGRIRMPVRVTDRIMPGVTAISQGAWYRPDKNGTDTAGSINVLTSLHPTPYARGNGQHTNLVEVTRYGL